MTTAYDDAILEDDDGSDAGGWDCDYDLNPAATTGAGCAANYVNKDAANAIADMDEQHPDNGNLGTNNIYQVAWSVCENCLMDETKTVRVLVRWRVKNEFHTIDYFGVIPRM